MIRSHHSSAGTIYCRDNQVWAIGKGGARISLANFLPMHEGGSADATKLVRAAALEGTDALSKLTGTQWETPKTPKTASLTETFDRFRKVLSETTPSTATSTLTFDDEPVEEGMEPDFDVMMDLQADALKAARASVLKHGGVLSNPTVEFVEHFDGDDWWRLSMTLVAPIPALLSIHSDGVNQETSWYVWDGQGHTADEPEFSPELPLTEGSGRGQWYDNLWKTFKKRCEDPEFFTALSKALGHDPDYDEGGDEDEDGGDCLSPEELRHDTGWAWDNVREVFLEGRGGDDPVTVTMVLEALGVPTAGADRSSYDAMIDWVQTESSLATLNESTTCEHDWRWLGGHNLLRKCTKCGATKSDLDPK